jgi:hypothetical protein
VAVDDGARLFLVSNSFIEELDTRTGRFTRLMTAAEELAPGKRGLIGAALDRAAGALLFCNLSGNCVFRLRGIQL